MLNFIGNNAYKIAATGCVINPVSKRIVFNRHLIRNDVLFGQIEQSHLGLCLPCITVFSRMQQLNILRSTCFLHKLCKDIIIRS